MDSTNMAFTICAKTGFIFTGWWCNNHLETYESQWEGLSTSLKNSSSKSGFLCTFARTSQRFTRNVKLHGSASGQVLVSSFQGQQEHCMLGPFSWNPQ
jgi:hypothetical protein